MTDHDIHQPDQNAAGDVPVESRDDIGFEAQRQEAIAAYQAKATVANRGFRGNALTRLVVIAVGAAVVVIIGAVLVLQFVRASRNKPLDYDTYPGSTMISNASGSGSDVHAYKTPDSVQQVIDFYTQRLGKTDRDHPTGCTVDDTKTQGRCIVDNSQDDLTQRLMISISSVSSTTIIQVQRDWGGT